MTPDAERRDYRKEQRDAEERCDGAWVPQPKPLPEGLQLLELLSGASYTLQTNGQRVRNGLRIRDKDARRQRRRILRHAQRSIAWYAAQHPFVEVKA